MNLWAVARYGRDVVIAVGMLCALNLWTGGSSLAVAQAADDPGAPGAGRVPQPGTPGAGGSGIGDTPDGPVTNGRQPGASPIVGPGRSFGSLRDYLYGLWQWRNPRGQYVRFWFYRSGTFRFYNVSTQLGHYGSFRTVGSRLHLTMNRTCNGRQCVTNTPPRRISSTMLPQSQNMLLSANERWFRLKRY